MNMTISMPDQFVKRMREYAKETGMSYSEIIRRALDAYWSDLGK